MSQELDPIVTEKIMRVNQLRAEGKNLDDACAEAGLVLGSYHSGSRARGLAPPESPRQKRKYTPEDRQRFTQEVDALRASGQSIIGACNTVGISTSNYSLWKLGRTKGDQKRASKSRWVKLSQVQDEKQRKHRSAEEIALLLKEIERRVALGENITQASKDLGIPRNSYQSWKARPPKKLNPSLAGSMRSESAAEPTLTVLPAVSEEAKPAEVAASKPKKQTKFMAFLGDPADVVEAIRQLQ